MLDLFILKKGEPTFDVNGDPEEDSQEFCDDIQDIEDVIYDQMLILERILFMNRTVLVSKIVSTIFSSYQEYL